jgi:hypothetical protein
MSTNIPVVHRRVMPACLPVSACLLPLQNLYRIFYAESTDLPALQAPANPWAGTTCQTLPLLPALPTPGTPVTPTPVAPAPVAPTPVAPVPAPAPVPAAHAKDNHSNKKKRWAEELEEDEDPYDMFG